MKNNDHVAAIQQANAVKAITTRHETLKRDICKKARELVGPDREYNLLQIIGIEALTYYSFKEKRNCSVFVECMKPYATYNGR